MAGDAGHHDIDEDEVWGPRVREAQGLVDGTGLERVGDIVETGPDEPPDYRFVIDHEYAGAGSC